MNQRASFTIRRLRPAWILCLAGVIFIAFAGLGWWTARTTIRETRQLGGSASVAPPLVAFEPFAVDAMIQQITISGRSIPDDFVDQVVRNMTGLSSISLVRCQVSNSTLRHLNNVSSLEALDLRETNTDDVTAAVLAELPHLRHLALDRTHITDAALSELAKLPNITYLGLSHTAISDAGLEALRGHASLRILDLSHTDLSDEGLEHLATMNLNYVILEGTRVTSEGLARFKQHFRGVIAGIGPGI